MSHHYSYPLLVLKNMGNEFLSGYTSIAEGEKDPRNLLTAFAIARVILVEFDISTHVEVPWFPVSFLILADLPNWTRPCSILRSVISRYLSGPQQTTLMASVRMILERLFGKVIFSLTFPAFKLYWDSGHASAPHRSSVQWLYLYTWRNYSPGLQPPKYDICTRSFKFIC